jgi:4-diphosphocytidyl-2-C-methyl-D-erythritol kinase
MTPAEVDLTGRWLVILKPYAVSVSTAEAYAGVVPRLGGSSGVGDVGLGLPEILARPITEWRELLVNDFEISVLARYPEIAAVKKMLYDSGAVYASMSGSGSAVFGIFDAKPNFFDGRPDFLTAADAPKTENFAYFCEI